MADTVRRKAPLWLETLILLVIAVALALGLKTFFVQAFYIPSSSMRPGLVVNDRILVEKPSYWFGGEPERGDVVVFEDPGGWLPGPDPGPTNAVTRAMAAIGLYPTGGHLVKRVVGSRRRHDRVLRRGGPALDQRLPDRRGRLHRPPEQVRPPDAAGVVRLVGRPDPWAASS